MDFAAALLTLALKLAELQRPRIAESITVVGSAPSIATPAAVTVLGPGELALTPSVTLDDALRSVPGFSLFRRSSSRVANPTTQGVTLRGLAASGSSRALVLADDVPLNDPVGGWVYWNRVPAMALREVAVARGAAGDLHGADAIAGVVTLRSLQAPGTRLLMEGGSDATARVSGFGGRTVAGVDLYAAAEGFTTDGFVITAPESRGPIDTPARSRHGSAHGATGFAMSGARVTLRAAYFGESRGNGTPVQRNRTRVTQVSGSVAGGTGWGARGYALAQRYEQTFSAVAGDRSSERQTSAQEVRANAFGGSGDRVWSGGAGAVSVSVAGKLVAAELAETAFTAQGAPMPARLTTPRQSDASIAAQASSHRGRGSFGAGLRAELWRSELEDANQHLFVSPRFWGAYAVTGELSLRLALQSGYRGPTINELYRPFRVGNVITEANPLLRPESARGIEGGASWHRRGITVRALGFWSRVTDAIVNVTLASGPTIVRQRQNAARIGSAGAELELEGRVSRSLVLTGAASFTDSVFAAGPLEGLRVPQVPRAHYALGARGTVGALRLSAEWRHLAPQFDDDRNAFVLNRSSMTDVRAGWLLKPGLELFGAVENVLDQEQDVGRTPLRTIGLPRTSRVGVRLVF
ncbi:MAG TPA: TonB-dependent receptor [Vicinamibacterales bacterium]|nr:TonB-dependent receptor [Vicinamibacterales bacterium]